jgi:hypothetical protein
MFRLFLILIILLIPILINSQEKSLSETITSVAEELAEEENDPSSAATYAELLSDLADDPVSINTGDENEIGRLFFLTSFQVKVLSDYVITNGEVVSIYEIASIPGFDRQTASLIAPFISLKTLANDKPILKRPRQSILTNFILRPGQHEPGWPGSPVRSLVKYKIEAGSIAAGFTAEKDPGEKFLDGSPPAPDFLSGYLSYKGTGIIKRIVIGDFSARFGQGTGLNTGVNTVYSLTAPGNLSGRDELKPYTSTDENAFLRGVAITASLKRFSFSLFHSASRIDATIDTSELDGTLSARSLYKTGYHNSPSSVLKKNTVTETLTGADISFDSKNLRSGLLWTLNSFSIPFLPEKNSGEDLYKFGGTRNMVTSFYFNYLLKRFMIAGEISSSGVKEYAFIQNIAFRPSDRLNINILYRNYSPGFTSFHGRGPGQSPVCNEQSITGSFSFEAARGLFISAGSENRSYPWLRYGVSAPSSAMRHELRLKYIPADRLIFESSYQFRNTQAEGDVLWGIPYLDEEKSRSVRIQARYALGENITLVTRSDYRHASPSGQRGFLILQDIIYNMGRLPFSIWYRFCIFNTGGFDSGIYTWENDLLSSFNIPVLYGRGSRSYIMAGWKAGSFADIRIKYWMSSQEINGITENADELRIQVRLRF